MIAIVFGLATAVLWATTLMASAPAARLIGPWSTLAWVMLIGLAVTVPLTLATGSGVSLTNRDLALMAAAGISNSAGLLLGYAAVQRGKVALVGPIVSTEGAIAAVLAILAGDPLTAAAGVVLAVIAVGVVLASIDRRAETPSPEVVLPATATFDARSTAATVGLALGAAVLFGINLFAVSRIATGLPLAWAILPARLAGVIGVTVPLILLRRLRLVRAAVPYVVTIGLAEVAGIATFALGARDSAPVTAVLASQFAGIAAIAAFLLYGERLGRIQVVGIVMIAIGVGTLAAVHAA